jgi:mycothiol system anti-sigma-R factor
MMNCADVQKFIHAYLDGEFDEREWAALSAHLDLCASCRRMAEFEERFRQTLKASMEPTPAPPALRDRVQEALRGQRREAPEARRRWARRWAWRLIPAAAAAGIIITVSLSRERELSPAASLASLADSSINWHRQHLPMDVTGPSVERVEQFFSDKVPFAVRPPAFEARGVQLVGARLTNLREHQAVTLTYQVHGRRVSVFIFDSQVVPHGVPATRVGKRNVFLDRRRGYNIAMYTSGGTGYAVTSDMDPKGLVQLISHEQ